MKKINLEKRMLENIHNVNKEKPSSTQKVKIGDMSSDGFKVISIVDDQHVLVSSRELAKVINKKEI